MTIRTTVLAAALLASAARAADVEFPYEAVVRAPDVEVRSGPGQSYYATGRLGVGDRVRVIRHDRGGWMAVEPPAGQFSYVRVEHVRSADGLTGVVDLPANDDGSPGRTVVRIGSAVSDDSAMSSRQLPVGERVVILGRKIVTTDAGEVEMYKIEPPEREYRWIKGDFVGPAPKDGPLGGGLVAEMPTPPAAGPSEFLPAEPKPRDPDPNTLLAQRKTLEEIDARFSAMAGKDPSAWRLDDLEAEYRALSDAAATDTLVGQIGQRLAAIETRRQVLRRFEDFHRMITETSEKERRLLSLQQSAGTTPASMSRPAGEKTAETQTPPLVGAGLIQKVRARVPGGPSYVLVAPDGRTLAYLRPSAGVNLDVHVGRQRGLAGTRRKDAALGGDVIDVTAVVPVRLEE